MTWRADGEVAQALREWARHISAETLALHFAEGQAGPVEGWFAGEFKLDGEPVSIALRRAQGAQG